jgi:hypothetical protein
MSHDPRHVFDYSDAPVYRKTATVLTANVEDVAKPQDVQTIINGKIETVNRAEVDDKIITGPVGERYVITKDQFEKLYEVDSTDATRYRSKNVVSVICLEEDTELVAPWGALQHATKGDFVVQMMNRR